MAPELEKAAQTIHEDAQNKDRPALEREQLSTVRFGIVEATEQVQLRKRFDVKGYPTILLYRDGATRVYRQPRTGAAFGAYMRAMLQPPVEVLASAAAIDKLDQWTGYRTARTTFAFLGPLGREFAAFQRVAAQLQGVATFLAPSGTVDEAALQRAAAADDARAAQGLAGRSMDGLSAAQQRTTAEAAGRLGVEQELFPVVAAISPAQTPKVFTGPFTVEDLRNWVSRNKLPLIGALSPDNFEDVTGAPGRLTMFIVVDPSHGMSGQYVQSLLPVARRHSDRFVFTVIDGVQFAAYVKQFGVTERHMPTLVVLDYPNELFYVDELTVEAGTGLYSVAQVEAFVADMAADRVLARSTTTWYSPTRYKRMVERFLHQFSEPQIMGIMVALMLLFAVVFYGMCMYTQAETPQDAERERKLREAQAAAAAAAPRGPAAPAAGQPLSPAQTKAREDARAAALRSARASAPRAEQTDATLSQRKTTAATTAAKQLGPAAAAAAAAAADKASVEVVGSGSDSEVDRVD